MSCWSVFLLYEKYDSWCLVGCCYWLVIDRIFDFFLGVVDDFFCLNFFFCCCFCRMWVLCWVFGWGCWLFVLDLCFLDWLGLLELVDCGIIVVVFVRICCWWGWLVWGVIFLFGLVWVFWIVCWVCWNCLVLWLLYLSFLWMWFCVWRSGGSVVRCFDSGCWFVCVVVWCLGWLMVFCWCVCFCLWFLWCWGCCWRLLWSWCLIVCVWFVWWVCSVGYWVWGG